MKMVSEKVISFKNPDRNILINVVNSALKNNSMLIVLGKCKVFYYGRAESRLSSGDRVIIVKPDGTVLIHQNKKRKPVNWQPPGSSVMLVEKEGRLFIKSVRRKPKEVILVELEDVYEVIEFKALDYNELNLYGSESEMGDYIMNHPEVIEEGFVPLEREKAIMHGKIDLFGKDKDGNLVVIELKRRTAGLNAVSQLKRYVDEFKSAGYNVRGILVAPQITSGARRFLIEEGLEFKPLSPKKSIKKE